MVSVLVSVHGVRDRPCRCGGVRGFVGDGELVHAVSEHLGGRPVDKRALVVQMVTPGDHRTAVGTVNFRQAEPISCAGANVRRVCGDCA